MSEADAPEIAAPAAEQVADVAAAVDAEPEPAKRQFVKRLPKPDQSLVKTEVEKLKDQISQNQQRQDAIREELEKRRNGRTSSPEQQSIKNRLMELRAQFMGLLAQKKQVRVELDAVNSGRDSLREQLKGMKGKMEYTSVEKIDDAIARLEGRLQHSSMPLSEEKKILEDIKKLRASRTSVASYNAKLETLNGDEQSRGTIVERLKAADEKLEVIKAEEQQQREKLTGLQSKDAKKNEDVPALKEERDQCREVVKLLRARIDEVKAVAQAKNDEYWNAELAWREQRTADKVRRDAEWEVTKAEKDLAYKARMAELAGEPFNQEVTLCEQVEAYLARFAGDDKAPEATEDAKSVEAPAGTRPLVKAKDPQEDRYSLGAAKKGKKAKKAEKVVVKPAEQRLNHSLDILGAFGTLKLSVPLTTSQVVGAIEAVKEKRAEYLAKRLEVKETGFPVAEEVTAKEPHANGGPSAETSKPKKAQAPAAPAAQEPTPAESMGAAPAGEAGTDAPAPVVAAPSGVWKTAEAAAPAEVAPAEAATTEVAIAATTEAADAAATEAAALEAAESVAPEEEEAAAPPAAVDEPEG